VEPIIRQPTLFEMDKAEQSLGMADYPTGLLHKDRPYGEPGLLLGTSAFTASGWAGTFYPSGLSQQDYLGY
jgi:hypothetical protein